MTMSALEVAFQSDYENDGIINEMAPIIIQMDPPADPFWNIAVAEPVCKCPQEGEILPCVSKPFGGECGGCINCTYAVIRRQRCPKHGG